jgi:hypothetical protein
VIKARYPSKEKQNQRKKKIQIHWILRAGHFSKAKKSAWK